MGFVVGARSRTTGLNKLRHASKIFSKNFQKKKMAKKNIFNYEFAKKLIKTR